MNNPVTGSLQESKGFYFAVINLRDEHGDRKPKWVNTGIRVTKGNRRRAEEFLTEELVKWNKRNGIYVQSSVAEYFEYWLTTIEADIRPSTYRGYCGNMRNHIIPYFQEHPVALQDLTPIILEDYYFSLLRTGSSIENDTALSVTTIRHHHQNISKALNDAVRRGLLVSNPASVAKLPKKETYHAQYLNAEQLEEMLELFEGTSIELPVQLASIYGMRRSEVLGLTWEFVDFESRTITIAQTLQQGDYLDSPKTDSSYRTLPMTKKAERLLREQKEKQKRQKELLGNYYVRNNFVCTMQNGAVITPNYLTRNFHTTLNNSTLPLIRFHDLRHSVASNLINSGMPITGVQEWLGHSNATTTLAFYAHASVGAKSNIADYLDKEDAAREARGSKNPVRIVKKGTKKRGAPR